MRKCPRCNAPISDQTNVCPNCNAQIRGGKYLRQNSKSRIRLPLIFGLVMILVCIAAFLIFELRFPDDKDLSGNSSLLIPDDLGLSEADLDYNNQRLYVGSQILVTTTVNTDFSKVEDLVDTAGGNIIGYIPFSGDYHIDFPDGRTYEELIDICAEWEKESYIDSVSLNYAYRNSTSSINYYDDPWSSTKDDIKNDGWSEFLPNGNNWWAEAICLPSVWEMNLWNKASTVKVGVIDTIFAEEHKDLDSVIVKTWQNNVDPSTSEVESPDHGTHVSGIIAAEIGNGTGIAGVASCASPELYGFAMFGKAQETYVIDVMHCKYAIALMLEEGIKVINISMGNSDDCVFAAQNGNVQALNDINEFDSSMSEFLKKAIAAGYDFLIVKAAGNTGGYCFRACPVTATNLYGYEQVNYGEEGSTSQRCSTNYDWFAGISNPSVRDRIIVVGAAQQAAPKSTNYVATYFSNYDCDVYAPGENILSTIYSKNETAFKRGTSQAAPIVTGIATLAWSVNPDLSAMQVKEIIEKSVPNITGDGSDNVSIVNAAVAVYFAQQWATTDHSSGEKSAVLGTIYEVTNTNGQEENILISDAKVTVYYNDNEVYKTISALDGGFNEFLPAGKYSLAVEAPGYIGHTTSFELLPNEATYLSIQLYPEQHSTDIFSALPETFSCITASSRTTWELTVRSDASFISEVKIPDWGDFSPEYSNGTTYLTETNGCFTNIEKVNDYSYQMTASNINASNQAGQNYILDDVKYVVEGNTNFDNGDQFYLYLPGTPRSSFPQGLIDSVNNNGIHTMDEITPNTYVFYHPIPESNGFDLVFIAEAGNILDETQKPENSADSSIDVASTFGYDKAWDMHDKSGSEHFVTSFAFNEDGTFSCAVGWYLSEWYAAFTGTYEVRGNEIILHYFLNGQEKTASYQVKWENKILRQSSEENLVIPHQIGSEYPFEENPWYSASDLASQVETFIRYS